MLDPLMERAREIYDKAEPPEGRLGCNGYQLLEELINAARRRSA